MEWMEIPYLWMENKWIEASRKQRIWIYLSIYTLCFLVTFLLAYSPFWMNEKSFIWYNDGSFQHYPALIYIGKYIRQLIRDLFRGNLSFRMFDLNLGMGSDILTTLNEYGFGDPLNLILCLVPMKYTEYLYNFMCMFRVYLAGLSFSALCRYHKKRIPFILIGALIFTFSGYVIFTAVKHPFFINGMIQLPLLLIGIDLIMRGKKPYLFVFSVCYAGLCGFYILYMMTILLGIYVLAYAWRYITEKRLISFAKMSGRIAIGYLGGLACSAPVFLPTILAYLSSSRTKTFVERNLYSYGWETFRRYLMRIIAPPGAWDSLSCAAVILFAVVLMYAARNIEYRELKWIFAVCMLIYIIPAGGSVMNGFSYPSQRWTFGFALLLSFITVEMMPLLLNMRPRETILCMITLMAYACYVFAESTNRGVYYVVGAFMLALTLLVLLLAKTMCNEYYSRQRIGAVLCILLVIGNVSINAVYRFAEGQGNYIEEFRSSGSETQRMDNAMERQCKLNLDYSKGRIDSTSFELNKGSVWQVPTSYFYWSILEKNVIDFWTQTENAGQRTINFWVTGFDQRTRLGTLMSMKYLIDSESKIIYRPYGYHMIETVGEECCVLENDFALPWGYTYDNVIPYDSFQKMKGLEKEDAMIQGIVLEGAHQEISQAELTSEIQSIPYEIEQSDSFTWEDGVLNVLESNSCMKLNFVLPKQSEASVRIEGLDINPLGIEKLGIEVKMDDISNSVGVSSSVFSWYTGRENYLLNMGYSEDERTSCTITFPKKGTYLLKDIQVYALPMDSYPAQVEALRKEPLENIEFSTNKVTGTVDLSSNKILCMSIPYSKGWSAKVDGKPAEILRGNIMFMALPLEAGHHEIEFTYCTPGLRLGCLLSLFSVILLIVHYRRGRKRDSVAAQEAS